MTLSRDFFKRKTKLYSNELIIKHNNNKINSILKSFQKKKKSFYEVGQTYEKNEVDDPKKLNLARKPKRHALCHGAITLSSKASL